MPASINSALDSLQSSSSLAALISSLRTSSAAGAAQTSAAQIATGTDQLSIQNLPSLLTQAADLTRQVQRQAQQTQAAERGLRNLEPEIRQLRDLARQAGSSALSDQQRADLSARFSALQTRVGIAAAGITYQGHDLGELLQPDSQTAAADTSQVKVEVSGSAFVGGQQVEEQNVALADSQVAAERGVAEVRAEVAQGSAVFRFEDTGNGQIRATRYEQQNGELVAVGSQTVAVPNMRDQRLAGGQAVPLEFGRLGLEITLDARYAGGDLENLQLDATAPSTTTASSTASTQSTQPQSQGLTFDISQAADAQSAAASLDLMLTRSGQLRRELRAEQELQSQSALAGLQALSSGASTATPLTQGTAQSLATSLQQLVLQQATTALSSQGSLDQSRVANLLT